MRPRRTQVKDDLKMLIALLEKEKKALIQNDVAVIDQTTVQKMEMMPILEEFRMEPPASDQELVQLAETINELQKTNLLLARQALRFQENLLECILLGVEKAAGTYSQQGGYGDATTGMHFIDQKG